jgi:hypothetical protein
VLLLVIFHYMNDSQHNKATRGRRGRDRMVVSFMLLMQSVPITTIVVSSNSDHGEVYSIQHNVIKFVNDLRQVGEF